uniref:Phosphodiesterase n=2 Tax=Cacopsylla melanoneura TaxID=428564 RepID=A0A8D8VUM6_9HEMI
MAYLINENSNSTIQETKLRNKELINNNSIVNENEEVRKVEENNKETEEEKEKGERIGCNKPISNKCDENYHKQYSNNNVQSNKCDIKQYDKPVHDTSRTDGRLQEDSCDKTDDVFSKESNCRKDEKNEYCEQFSESIHSNDDTGNTCNRNSSEPTSKPTDNSNQDVSSKNIPQSGMTEPCNNTLHINSNSKLNNSLSHNNSTKPQQTLNNNPSKSSANSLSPKFSRVEHQTAQAQTNQGSFSAKSSRTNSERSFKYETSPVKEIQRHSRESSLASSGSRNSLNCDRKVSYETMRKHSDRELSVNDLSEELVEKWIVNNASNAFIDRVLALKQNERTRRELRQDETNARQSETQSRGSQSEHHFRGDSHRGGIGRKSDHGFSSLETVSTTESAGSNVSNSIESVSSYTDPVSSCLDLTVRNSSSTCNKRTSVTSDLFNLWISNSPIKRCKSPSSRPRVSGEWKQQLNLLDEGDLFMELIKDISNELDIDVLCHKILVNVGLLTRADRGSLFLAKGSPDNRYLVAKLFDVTVDTELDEAVQKARNEELTIPFGVGVAGTVAQNKEIVNIKNAYEDPRFNNEIDRRTGYTTNSILCVPINSYEGEVIGVAQIINKTDGSASFTDRDIEVFQRYLTFCGIGIQNAQLFEMSILEFERNQILLKLARSIFEEQSNLECLVTKIMTEARDLLKCERCAVFLLKTETSEASHLERILERPGRVISERKPLCRRESNNVDIEDILSHTPDDSNIAFSTVFELGGPSGEASIKSPGNTVCNTHSRLATIAKYVASTGQILNIGDVPSWMREEACNDEDEDNSDFTMRCILCMPIFNGQKTVIGVAQLINKVTLQPFTDCDVSIFEAFAIFCGLGIHNTQMYENACKLMAKQKVALECLSYHATASSEDTRKLIKDSIPSATVYNLYSFKFIDFDLSDMDTCRATIRMFLECNLVQQYHIPYDVLCRWVLSVKKNYRPVKYHNWRHALNVAQTMFAMLKTGKMERFMSDLEILGLLVACLCHDLDHRGTNNAFQTKVGYYWGSW